MLTALQFGIHSVGQQPTSIENPFAVAGRQYRLAAAKPEDKPWIRISKRS